MKNINVKLLISLLALFLANCTSSPKAPEIDKAQSSTKQIKCQNQDEKITVNHLLDTISKITLTYDFDCKTGDVAEFIFNDNQEAFVPLDFQDTSILKQVKTLPKSEMEDFIETTKKTSSSAVLPITENGRRYDLAIEEVESKEVVSKVAEDKLQESKSYNVKITYSILKFEVIKTRATAK